LYAKYGTRLERESAHEQLAARVEQAAEAASPAPAPKSRRAESKSKPAGDPLTDFLGSRQGRALQREVVRGVFGMLRKQL
jgi:hypothetical protein